MRISAIAATMVGLLIGLIATIAVAVESWPTDDDVHGTACGGAVAWTAESDADAEWVAGLYTPEKCDALARGEGRLAE